MPHLKPLVLLVSVLLAPRLPAEDVAGPAGKPVAVDGLTGIVVSPLVSDGDRESVKRLQDWLKRIYGLELKVIEGSDAPAEGVILLGKGAALRSGLVRQAELDAVTPGGHVVKCADGRIVIAGPDSWSTLYGVAAFLEAIGVRFYLGFPFDDRNPVPKPKNREIGPFAISDKPVFPFRSAGEVTFRETFREVADARKGANPEIFTPEAGSDLWIDHTSGYLVPKMLCYDDHPEYYPLLDTGKRIAKDGFSDARTALCLSNPEVTRLSTERLLAWIGNEKEKRYFFVTYGDTGLYCQCPQCLKLDEGVEPVKGRHGQSHYAKRHLHWVNPVARAVGAKYPDKILFTFAYAGSDTPPREAQVEPNVWIIASTGLGSVRFWDHAMSQEGADDKYFAKLNGWLKIVPDRLLVCEYLAYTYKPAMLECMEGRLRAYAKKGLLGVVFTYGTPTNFQPLWKYVFARMKWNPNQDAQKLAREFVDFYYGPAAKPIAEFFALSHERYLETLKAGIKPENPWQQLPGYYEPEFVRKLMLCLQAAARAELVGGELKAEIKKEESLLLEDVLENMPAYELTEGNKALFRIYLTRRRDLARDMDKEKDFVSETRHLAAELEKKHKGYVPLFEGWLKEWFWWLNPPEPGKTSGDKEKEEELEGLE
jgi:hypothetical protein